ncbi:hypothetical protein E2C01_070990 [Portunus trituberculatus]|uniref:Uncharacterized protein n=1 Tax=Portunus trituberculatus TaxID=210409 RepID=A0A5B7I6Y4_PORTR|nr:hypothetical protein [Portunus trituberculatus]
MPHRHLSLCLPSLSLHSPPPCHPTGSASITSRVASRLPPKWR